MICNVHILDRYVLSIWICFVKEVPKNLPFFKPFLRQPFYSLQCDDGVNGVYHPIITQTQFLSKLHHILQLESFFSILRN